MPKISVVMSIYNTKEEYLREAIESILNQTYSDFEFIIINDGSTNNAEEVVLSYRDKRIKYIKHDNIGFSKSLNKGFDIATGEYIARMDSDDISLPERFEKQIGFLETHKDVSILGAWHKRFPNGDIRCPAAELGYLDLYTGNYISHPTVMLRREDFNKYNLRYDPEYTSEDYELWTRVLRYLKFCNLQEVLYLYRWSGNNVSCTKDIFVESDRKIRKNILNFLSCDSELQEELNSFLLNRINVEKKLNFPEKIFSLRNSLDKKYKIITILGLQIMIKKGKKNNAKNFSDHAGV